MATPETVVEMANLTGGMMGGLFDRPRTYRCPSGHVTIGGVGSTPRRPTLTRVAALLWLSGVAVFLGAGLLGFIYTASAKTTDEYAGWTILTYPLVASLVWVPLAIASLIVAIIALARGERGRQWAIALLVVNAVSLPFAWVAYRALIGG